MQEILIFLALAALVVYFMHKESHSEEARKNEEIRNREVEGLQKSGAYDDDEAPDVD
jgi:hypothetical protein